MYDLCQNFILAHVWPYTIFPYANSNIYIYIYIIYLQVTEAYISSTRSLFNFYL